MAGVTVEFNQRWFDQIGKSAGVTALTQDAAQRVLAQAVSTAPVDSGDYRAGLRVERKQSRYRNVFLVVGNDWKTLLIEAQTGNLARALKRVANG